MPDKDHISEVRKNLAPVGMLSDEPSWQPKESGTQQIITRKSLFVFATIAAALLLGMAIANVKLPIIAGVFVTLLFGIFVLMYPYIGLLGYLIVVLIRPQEIWTSFGGKLPIERALALLVLAATAVRPEFLRKNKVVWSPLSSSLIGFTFVLGLSVGIAVWRSYALQEFIEFSKLIVLFILITQLVTNRRRLSIFVGVFIACHIWIAGSTVWAYYNEPAYVRMGIQRAHALAVTLSDPNSVAASLSYVAPFAIYLLPFAKKLWMKIGLVGYLGVAVFCTVFTGSRSGMLTFVVVALIVAWRSRRRIPAMIASFAILMMVWGIMPHQYQDRFRTIYTEVPDQQAAGAGDSAKGRIRGLKLGIKMLVDRPILGVGIGCFAPAWFSEYTIEGMHDWSQPHNMVAQLISESGILGLFAFSVFSWLYYREYRRIRKLLGGKDRIRSTAMGATIDACYVGFILLWFNGLFGHNLYRYNWYMFAGFIVIAGKILRDAANAKIAAQPTPSPFSHQPKPELAAC